MRRFHLSPAAERDLDHIKSYLLAQAGPRITRRVLGEIRAAIRMVAADPGLGHLRQDLTERDLRFWPIYSYLIVYSAKKPVTIVRLLHGMRNVEALLH